MKRLFLLAAFLGLWSGVRAGEWIEAKEDRSFAMAPASDSLALRLERLERRASGWDKLRDRLPRFSGYLQAGYQGGTGESSFFVKSVRVILTGDLVPKLDYCLQAELVSPRLVDAYLRYRPFAALNFQLGEFKLPFSIENTDYPPLGMEFIEYPMALCHLMGFDDLCGLTATGRDLGAMIYGSFFRCRDSEVLSYDFGVFNGEGINTWDRNKSKDLTARLKLRPVRGLLLAGYWYRGEYGPHYQRRVRYGGGACYDRGRLVVRGEWIGGTTGQLDSEGWYVMGGVRPAKSLTAAVRYDTFLENRDDRLTRQTNYTVGLSWQPLKYFRCQLDYTYEEYRRPGSRNRNVVALMLSGIF